MRDYLYIWHDPARHLIVASGIEFKDFLPYLKTRGGLVLLTHQSETASTLPNNLFGFVAAANVCRLAAEDIYSWGDFVWADSGSAQPSLTAQDVAELLFFQRMAEPLKRIHLPRLDNQLLCHVHDDGWHLMLYYKTWAALAGSVLPTLSALLGTHLSTLKKGRNALWVKDGAVKTEKKTQDVDSILNRQLKGA